MNNTYILELDDTERAIVIIYLNTLRNRLINQNRYTNSKNTH